MIDVEARQPVADSYNIELSLDAGIAITRRWTDPFVSPSGAVYFSFIFQSQGTEYRRTPCSFVRLVLRLRLLSFGRRTLKSNTCPLA
jgi:hypothetical protein